MGRGTNINAQRALLKQMGRGANAYSNHANDQAIIEEVANIPVVSSSKLVTVGQGLYNPPFKAQIQTSILKLYFTESSDVYTAVAPASIVASLKTSLPAFLFSNSDYAAGFAKLQGQYSLGSFWQYGDPFIYGRDYPVTAFGVLDATVIAQLRKGDLVFPFTAVTSGPVNTLALVIVRTSDVPYATLLDATNSNRFDINLIRYTVTAGQETQFANAILCAKETMFGKFTSDPINPEAFKNPEQDQDNIIDIDVSFAVDKESGLSTFVNFDILTMRWNIFISSAVKI